MLKKLSLVALFLAPSFAMATTPMAAQLSYANRTQIGYRAALLFKPTSWHWGSFSADWHVGLGAWRGLSAERNRLTVISVAPELRWQFLKHDTFQPYVYAGVGPAYVSKTVIAGRNLGSHFLFEDSAGLGTTLGQSQAFDVSVGVMHYSHAGLAGTQNSGFTLAPIVNVAYQFTN